jgi:hypothetical protein
LDKHQTLHNFWGGIEIIIIKDREEKEKKVMPGLLLLQLQ